MSDTPYTPTPADVVTARRGFAYRHQELTTPPVFSSDEHADLFFDQMAEEGAWSADFYREYADLMRRADDGEHR